MVPPFRVRRVGDRVRMRGRMGCACLAADGVSSEGGTGRRAYGARLRRASDGRYRVELPFHDREVSGTRRCLFIREEGVRTRSRLHLRVVPLPCLRCDSVGGRADADGGGPLSDRRRSAPLRIQVPCRRIPGVPRRHRDRRDRDGGRCRAHCEAPDSCRGSVCSRRGAGCRACRLLLRGGVRACRRRCLDASVLLAERRLAGLPDTRRSDDNAVAFCGD